MRQPTIISQFILAFGLILLNFVGCTVFEDEPSPVLARYDVPSEVLENIFTSDVPKDIRNVDNFLDKVKRNGMVIHEGNDPPEIAADGSDDMGKKYIIEHDCIFDEQTPTNVESLYGKYEETIRIFPSPSNIVMADVSYSSIGDDDYPQFHQGMDRGSGRGYVSGSGNNFTIFYKVEEGQGTFEDIPYEAIWIISGTVSDRENARRITNVTKCLIMLQKGDDPNDQVANRGTIRIFKDDNPEWIQPEVVISGFSPTEGPHDTEVTISGSGFGTVNDALTVLFNGRIAEVLKRNPNQLLVKVPQGAGTGPVTVKVNDKIGMGGVFTYIPGAPDLVVTGIEQTGPATVNENKSVEVPIIVTVLNRGDSDAGIFKISISYVGPNTPDNGFVVAFTVPGQSDLWYPSTQDSLVPGSEVSFRGILTFNPSLHGITVSVYAVADSCSGDELVPDYCRVLESNEVNNNSSAISVILP